MGDWEGASPYWQKTNANQIHLHLCLLGVALKRIYIASTAESLWHFLYKTKHLLLYVHRCYYYLLPLSILLLLLLLLLVYGSSGVQWWEIKCAALFTKYHLNILSYVEWVCLFAILQIFWNLHDVIISYSCQDECAIDSAYYDCLQDNRFECRMWRASLLYCVFVVHEQVFRELGSAFPSYNLDDS